MLLGARISKWIIREVTLYVTDGDGLIPRPCITYPNVWPGNEAMMVTKLSSGLII